MKEFRNPIFDLGVAGVILFVIGIFILNTNPHYGYIIMVSGFVMGILFTLVNIIGVARTKTLKGQMKIFWLIIVVLVPVFGSFIYQIFTRKNERNGII